MNESQHQQYMDLTAELKSVQVWLLLSPYCFVACMACWNHGWNGNDWDVKFDTEAISIPILLAENTGMHSRNSQWNKWKPSASQVQYWGERLCYCQPAGSRSATNYINMLHFNFIIIVLVLFNHLNSYVLLQRKFLLVRRLIYVRSWRRLFKMLRDCLRRLVKRFIHTLVPYFLCIP